MTEIVIESAPRGVKGLLLFFFFLENALRALSTLTIRKFAPILQSGGWVVWGLRGDFPVKVTI